MLLALDGTDPGTVEELWDWGGGGGGTISDSILGGTKHFFLLILYNFKNIGGAHASPALPPTHTQRSLWAT